MKWTVLILAVLLLIACDQSVTSKPIGEGGLLSGKTELSPCANISCGKNALCKEGECICRPDYEDCDRANPGQHCTPEGGCCSDADCKESEICDLGECKYSCDKVECISNKVCYDKQEGCFCPEEYKWCDIQKLCIPLENCCGGFDCNKEELCTNTIESGKICLYGEHKSCKYLGSIAKDFGIDGKTFTIGAKKFHYNEWALIQINDEEYKMHIGDNVTVDGITINLETLKTTGGLCKTRDRSD